ncbi:hypothetical protein WOLCODRAFT_117451 [Wolfiporia cocos MD-104 SS10]|uniref:Uncharacterized protein n=1 Tax=Wolfiporia cocos (strain MD-104) TaxID=742152 RepID=A0A2H3JP41_WOLCO|nr:hypothetical protein WOLCODRAFT_117451 [Wolfiporia cocos MD-104 SS10]
MTEWEHRAAQNGTPGYAIYKGNIKKPDLDDRHYRLIHLESGTRTMLAHDPAIFKGWLIFRAFDNQGIQAFPRRKRFSLIRFLKRRSHQCCDRTFVCVLLVLY